MFKKQFLTTKGDYTRNTPVFDYSQQLKKETHALALQKFTCVNHRAHRPNPSQCLVKLSRPVPRIPYRAGTALLWGTRHWTREGPGSECWPWVYRDNQEEAILCCHPSMPSVRLSVSFRKCSGRRTRRRRVRGGCCFGSLSLAVPLMGNILLQQIKCRCQYIGVLYSDIMTG